jgi:uncharacterized protein YndB with AHSA1/START domain
MNEHVVRFSVPPVIKSVTVGCSPEKAFRIFTTDLGKWWPLASHHMSADPQACMLEPQVGGRLLERSVSGAESVWGRVEAWEPPRRVVFTWLVGPAAEHPQRIEVTFAAEGERTKVVLTHSGWEALGERAAALRDSYDNGWVAVFERGYGAYANSAS